MAAVTGDLGSAPGVVLFERAESLAAAVDALGQARRDRSPVLVLQAGETTSPAIEPSVWTALGVAVNDRARRAGVTGAEPLGVTDAARLALAHPRGPVIVRWRDVPANGDAGPGGTHASAQAGDLDAGATPLPDVLDAPAPPDVLDAIADLLARSSRPVVIAGLEARAPDDREWLRAFAEAMPAPVVATSKARGVLPEPHPLSLGVLGMSDAVLDRADVVLAIGVDPVELSGIAWRWRAPVVSIRRVRSDEPPFAVAIGIRASVASVLEELAPRLKGRTRADWDVAALDRAKRALTALSEVAGRAGSPDAARVVVSVREATAAGTVATVEGRWLPVTAGWQCVAPGDLLGPLAPAMTGYAVPAAIAARLARPDRGVVCFTDAAGLEAAIATLEVAARHRIGFAIVALTPCSRAILDAARAAGAGVAGVPGAVPLAVIAAIAAGTRPVVMPAV